MQKTFFLRSPSPDGTEAATDYLSELADALDLPNKLTEFNLESKMKESVENNLQLLKETHGKALDAILTYTESIKDQWCGYTAARAYMSGGLPKTLKLFFEGVNGINCFVSYKDDGGRGLRLFHNGIPFLLSEIHERLDCMRFEYTVQDVLDGYQYPIPGDIVLLDWHNDDHADHIQMVYSYNGENNYMVVIEGNGTSFINTDLVGHTESIMKTDGLTQVDRLAIVQHEMENSNWNKPSYAGTWMGLTAYVINEALAQQSGTGTKCRIVKFVRPSAMDFLPLNEVKYDSPYHGLNH